ncbi:MAG: site-specific integrase [Planctomycetota bacterium]|nr:site-specific integrase [Planctomycetota bacterium]
MATRGRPRKLPQLILSAGRWRCEARDSSGARVTLRFGTVESLPEPQARHLFSEWLTLYAKDPGVVNRFPNPMDAINHRRADGADAPLQRLVDERSEYLKSREPTSARDRVAGNRGRLCLATKVMGDYLPRPIRDFGPAQLEAAQAAMVAYRYRHPGDPEGTLPRRLLRSSINRSITEVKRAFAWGVSRKLATEDMAAALKSVMPLRRGHAPAGETPSPDSKEREAVEPVEMNAALTPDRVNPIVADLLRVIWYTGCRPEEACILRGMDIDMSDPECWTYTPGSDAGPFGKHKTAGLGRPKFIALLPIVQDVLRPYLASRKTDQYVFAPGEAVVALFENRRKNRKTPLTSGNRPGSNVTDKPMISPGDHYTSHSVYTALRRACQRAGCTPFSPYDLRRTVATWLAEQPGDAAGIELAQEALGHGSNSTTKIYLRKHRLRAIRRAKQIAPMIESRRI